MKPGREDGLHQRLAGLEVLARDRRARLLRELDQRREVGGEVRRAVGVRDPGLDRAVGVDHRGQDVGVALVEALLELLERGVDVARLAVDLGRAAPDHHQPVAARSPCGSARCRPMTWSARSRFDLPFLTFGPFSFLTYCGSKTAGQGLMPSRKSLIGSRSRRLEDAGLLRRLVGVVGEDVPAAEDEVLEPGERHEVLDQRGAVVRPLAEADGPHLRQAADGLGEAAPDRLDAGDERRRHRAHARAAARRASPSPARSRAPSLRSSLKVPPARSSAMMPKANASTAERRRPAARRAAGGRGLGSRLLRAARSSRGRRARPR